jgi:hypothetical protein
MCVFAINGDFLSAFDQVSGQLKLETIADGFSELDGCSVWVNSCSASNSIAN